MMSSPYLFFLRSYLLPFTTSKECDTAIEELLNRESFRCEYNMKNPWLNSIRYFIRNIKEIFAKKEETNDITHSNFAWVYFSKHRKMITEYLQINTNKSVEVICQEDLRNNSSILKKIYSLLGLTLTFLIIQIVIIFKKNKGQIVLTTTVLTELQVLYNFVINNQAKELYNFDAAEANTYFSSLFLSKNGIKVTLVPSSNPISFYYKKVYCETFIFTAPFQTMEYEKLKSNWSVKNLKSWKPRGAEKTILNKSSQIKPKNDLGFLSSAMKLREILNHTNLLNNSDLKSELLLLSVLKQLVKNNNYKLIIYLHPLEKNTEKNLTLAKEFYQGLFGKDIEFAPIDKSSKECFNLCDIGISSFSSSQIERLYGGYKVIFTPFEFLSNYFGDNRLDRISANSVEELFELIEKIATMTSDEYFEYYNLKEYRWDSYQ